MNLFRFFRPLIIGVLVLLVIFGSLFIYIRMEISGSLDFDPNEEYTPRDGVWYCEELKMRLSFSKEHLSTVVVGGEELQCACINDIGSDNIYVLCQESDNQVYALGELILCLEYVSLDGEAYTVKDHRTEETYIFLRLHQNESSCKPENIVAAGNGIS